ncbi:hypothetical protein GCM10027043_12800 [Ferruginibacter profundus]
MKQGILLPVAGDGIITKIELIVNKQFYHYENNDQLISRTIQKRIATAFRQIQPGSGAIQFSAIAILLDHEPG